MLTRAAGRETAQTAGLPDEFEFDALGDQSRFEAHIQQLLRGLGTISPASTV